MKLSLRIIPSAAIALLALASTASAGDLFSPTAFVGLNHYVACKLYNISTAGVSVDVQVIDADDGTVVVSTGVAVVAPNNSTQVLVIGPGRVLCRFVGAKKTKVRASMTIFDPASTDTSDEVVVAAY